MPIEIYIIAIVIILLIAVYVFERRYPLDERRDESERFERLRKRKGSD